MDPKIVCCTHCSVPLPSSSIPVPEKGFEFYIAVGLSDSAFLKIENRFLELGFRDVFYCGELRNCVNIVVQQTNDAVCRILLYQSITHFIPGIIDAVASLWISHCFSLSSYDVGVWCYYPTNVFELCNAVRF